MADAVGASGAAGKLVIKNIGLVLSGDLARPILDADTIVAVDGNKLDIDFEKAGPKKVLDSFIEAA